MSENNPTASLEELRARLNKMKAEQEQRMREIERLVGTPLSGASEKDTPATDEAAAPEKADAPVADMPAEPVEIETVEAVKDTIESEPVAAASAADPLEEGLDEIDEITVEQPAEPIETVMETEDVPLDEDIEEVSVSNEAGTFEEADDFFAVEADTFEEEAADTADADFDVDGFAPVDDVPAFNAAFDDDDAEIIGDDLEEVEAEYDDLDDISDFPGETDDGFEVEADEGFDEDFDVEFDIADDEEADAVGEALDTLDPVDAPVEDDDFDFEFAFDGEEQSEGEYIGDGLDPVGDDDFPYVDDEYDGDTGEELYVADSADDMDDFDLDDFSVTPAETDLPEEDILLVDAPENADETVEDEADDISESDDVEADSEAVEAEEVEETLEEPVRHSASIIDFGELSGRAAQEEESPDTGDESEADDLGEAEAAVEDALVEEVSEEAAEEVETPEDAEYTDVPQGAWIAPDAADEPRVSEIRIEANDGDIPVSIPEMEASEQEGFAAKMPKFAKPDFLSKFSKGQDADADDSEPKEYEYVDVAEMAGPITAKLKEIVGEYYVFILMMVVLLVAFLLVQIGRHISTLFVALAFGVVAALMIIALYFSWKNKKKADMDYERGKAIYETVHNAKMEQVTSEQDADEEEGEE